MTETAGGLAALLITYGVVSGAYRVIYDSSLNYEIWLEIKKIFSKSGLYDVSSVEFSNKNYYVVIEEDGVKIPVKCPLDVYGTLKEMLKLNKNDIKIKIKAKIDRRNLSLNSVKGYLIK